VEGEGRRKKGEDLGGIYTHTPSLYTYKHTHTHTHKHTHIYVYKERRERVAKGI
jgi:hypothetical protein